MKPLKYCDRDCKNIKNYLADFWLVIRKILFNRQTWKEVSVIIALSVIFGIVSNLGLIKRFLAGEFRQAFILQEKFSGLTFISLPEAEDLWFNQQAVFIDSRSQEEFIQGHIPGAISLPLQEVKRGNQKFLEIIDKLNPDGIFVVYCEGGDCQTSLNLGKILYQKGWKNLKIFSGGWAEWTAAGKPVEK